MRDRPSPNVPNTAYKIEDGVSGSRRTRTEERVSSRMTYYEFMILGHAKLVSIGCDNTKDLNLVAIKRWNEARESLVCRIQPFTSDYVVSIREKYLEKDDLLVIYE